MFDEGFGGKKEIFRYKDGERDVVVLATLHSLERQKGF